jgi:hypothetical protein
MPIFGSKNSCLDLFLVVRDVLVIFLDILNIVGGWADPNRQMAVFSVFSCVWCLHSDVICCSCNVCC